MELQKIKSLTQKYQWVIYALSLIVLVLLIAFMVYFFFSSKAEAGKCLLQPVQYYQEKTNMTCSCFDSKGNVYGNPTSQVQGGLPYPLNFSMPLV